MNTRNLSATPTADLDASLDRLAARIRQNTVDLLAARTEIWAVGLDCLDASVPARRRLRLARRGFHALSAMQRKGTALARHGLPDDLARTLDRLPDLIDLARELMA